MPKTTKAVDANKTFSPPAPTKAAPLGSAEYFLSVAKSQIGYIEGPKENQTRYGAFTGANFLAWCGSYALWCANQSGVKLNNVVLTSAGAESYVKAGRWFSTPQKGDLAFMNFDKSKPMVPGSVHHIGIVDVDNKDGTAWFLEGNTTSSVHGSERNGGEVCRKLRAYAKNTKGIQISVVGFGRPDFAKSAAAPTAPKPEKVVPTSKYPGTPILPGEVSEHVRAVQVALGISPADGQFGPATKKVVAAFQETKKIQGEQDGTIGPKTWKNLSRLLVE